MLVCMYYVCIHIHKNSGPPLIRPPVGNGKPGNGKPDLIREGPLMKNIL